MLSVDAAARKLASEKMNLWRPLTVMVSAVRASIAFDVIENRSVTWIAPRQKAVLVFGGNLSPSDCGGESRFSAEDIDR